MTASEKIVRISNLLQQMKREYALPETFDCLSAEMRVTLEGIGVYATDRRHVERIADAIATLSECGVLDRLQSRERR